MNTGALTDREVLDLWGLVSEHTENRSEFRADDMGTDGWTDKDEEEYHRAEHLMHELHDEAELRGIKED